MRACVCLSEIQAQKAAYLWTSLTYILKYQAVTTEW